jgi:hypothetical protein
MKKIRVIKLKDTDDVGVLDLTKAFAVRKKTNEKKSVALAVYFAGAPAEMLFPQSAFKFEFVEIAMDGVVHYSPTDIDTIVATFTMLD